MLLLIQKMRFLLSNIHCLKLVLCRIIMLCPCFIIPELLLCPSAQSRIGPVSMLQLYIKAVEKKLSPWWWTLWLCLCIWLTGITQEMINETRASTERRMLGDIQELLRQGEEVNQQDSQGATLVRLCLSVFSTNPSLKSWLRVFSSLYNYKINIAELKFLQGVKLAKCQTKT